MALGGWTNSRQRFLSSNPRARRTAVGHWEGTLEGMSAGLASGVDMSKDAKQHVAGVATTGVATTGVANTGADAGGSDGRFSRTVACAELTIRTAAAPVACDVLTIRATAARGRDLQLYRLVLGFISALRGVGRGKMGI